MADAFGLALTQPRFFRERAGTGFALSSSSSRIHLAVLPRQSFSPSDPVFICKSGFMIPFLENCRESLLSITYPSIYRFISFILYM